MAPPRLAALTAVGTATRRFAATRTWRVMALGVVLAVGGVGVAPAQAIVNGTLDTQHRSVGSLVQRDSEGNLQARCSGFLAAPTVFVTANHCFSIFGIPDGAVADVTFDRSITDTSIVVHGVARWNTTTGLGI